MTKYLFVVFLIVVASAAVPQLTISDIESTLKSTPLAIVKFFSPNCGHCVAMAPEYEKLYEQSQGKKYKVFEVDCSAESAVCSYIKIQGYPTLRLYSNGAVFTYNGDRTASAMQAWITAIDTASLDQLEPEQVKAKIGVETFVLVSGYSDKEKRSIAIQRLNSKFDTKFYALKSTTTFIRLYTKGSKQFQEFSKGDQFPASLISWSFLKGRDSILQLTSKLFSYIYQQTFFSNIVVIIDQNDALAAQARPFLQQWCNKNRLSILCVSANKQSQAYTDILMTTKGSEQKTTISFITSDFSIGYHYAEQTATAESLHQFFEDAKADKIYRSIDQEREAQARFAFKNIVRLTNQNYNQTITNNEFVFIQYYSPRCGHCIQFAEQYEQVATQLKEIDPSVIVAGVDASAQGQINSQENIQSFPTFKMYIHGKQLEYPGGRSAEAIINFIAKITQSKLLSAQSQSDIPRPFISIGGIQQKSHYNILPVLFDSYPIYRLAGESQFKIEIHTDDQSKTYTGEGDIQQIVDWIIDATSPVLVSLGESLPSKKLQRAIDKKLPLLVVLNKHQREFASPVLSFLEGYCKSQTQFVCGYVHKDEEDYEYLLEWSGDKDKVTNRLVWINTQKLSKFVYQSSDPNEVTKELLDDFITAVKQGRINPHKKEVVKAEKDQREELQEL